jgi:hypothetical protein
VYNIEWIDLSLEMDIILMINRILKPIVIILSIYLLYRLISEDAFKRLDYIFLIILHSLGLFFIIIQKYLKNEDEKSSC